jgi:carboxypeptidase Q
MLLSRLSAAIFAAALGGGFSAIAAAVPEPPAAVSWPSAADTVAGVSSATARRLIAAALADSAAWRRLGDLCNSVGSRLNGSEGQARAVSWAVREMRADGLADVHTERVMVPHWVRGGESGQVVSPVSFPLRLLGLGGTEGTPPAGIEAPLLVVRDFDELTARATEARGRIVLFNEAWQGYGQTVRYRARGADEAARCGAVACLIRSVTPNSLATPHTGIMRYADRADTAWAGVPRIPAAAITIENAERLQWLADAGASIRVRLRLDDRTLPDVESANVIGEVRGRDRPDQIVLIGAHLDSWDVGTGAHDDGAGCLMVLEAARLIRTLPQPPRRTIRVVLYQNEENSQSGGRGYAEDHAAELPLHVAALECDSGGFRPAGFSVTTGGDALARVARFARPLEEIGADDVTVGGSGADVAAIVKLGVPGLGERTEGNYFDYHHSPADTFDKVDARALAQNVAAVAVLAWSLAEDPQPLRSLVEQTR